MTSAVKVFEEEEQKKGRNKKEDIRHLVSRLIYQRGVPLLRNQLVKRTTVRSVNDTMSLRRGCPTGRECTNT